VFRQASRRSRMELKKEDPSTLEVSSEEEQIKKFLFSDMEQQQQKEKKVFVELGCGSAGVAKSLVHAFPETLEIKAFEVDKVQLEKNIASGIDCANLTFQYGGMQDIALEDESVDAVVMLKSLHHVPTELAEEGFQQVRRILKKGGKLFVSEPVFQGNFNEILRVFHDEEKVRGNAFEQLKKQVDNGNFQLEKEVHFVSSSNFPKGFEDFEERIIKSTHTHHQIDEDKLKIVKEKFEKHVKEDGSVQFFMPMRVDVLVKA